MRIFPTRQCLSIFDSSAFRAALVLLLFLFVAEAHAQRALSLADAVEAGLRHAPELPLLRDQQSLVAAQLQQARLRLNPRLYLQSEDLRPWDSSTSFADDTEDYGYLSQSFELDGRRSKRIALARANQQRSSSEQNLTLARLAASIADAYWTAQAADASATAWGEQLLAFDQLVAYQSARERDGAIAGVELLRTELEQDRVQLTAAQVQRDAVSARIELARITGVADAEKAALSEPLAQQRPVTLLALAVAVEQRPDVAAARSLIASAQADERLQRAVAVPPLDLLGGYKRDVGANTAYGGLQMDLPFFNRNQGEIARAHAARQLAEDELTFTQTDAAAEIRTAETNYTRALALVRDIVPGMRDRSAHNLSIQAEAYRSGGSDLLRLLDAEQVSISTNLLAISTWLDCQKATVALQLSYGERP